MGDTNEGRNSGQWTRIGLKNGTSNSIDPCGLTTSKKEHWMRGSRDILTRDAMRGCDSSKRADAIGFYLCAYNFQPCTST